MKIPTVLSSPISAALLTIATCFLLPTGLRAADHGDAPALAQDQGADIADVFAFMDPSSTGGDGKQNVILIATVHGFITPGEASNFAVFDPNIRYRLEIFNKHVNMTPPTAPATTATNAQKRAYAADQARYLKAVAPNRAIDVVFSKRATDPAAMSLRPNLKRALPQTATVSLLGFTGLSNKGVFKTASDSTALLTTPPSLSPTAAAQKVNTIAVSATQNIEFFAGEVDDPFFFDIPGFNAFVDSVRDPVVANSFSLSRGRDTFAGYNCLAIAFKIPKALLTNADISLTKIGVDFMTQRHSIQLPTSDGVKGAGAFKTIDRMGNPGINVVFLPFDRKNAYNAGTAKIDAAGKTFAGNIVETLRELGVDTTATAPTSAIQVLASIAIAKGDILQLDTSIANIQTGSTGGGGDNAGVGFGSLSSAGAGGGGRRLMDDTIDTVLKVVTGNGAASDNVPADQDGFLPTNAFPFLHTPHQPLDTAAGAEDGTRN